MIVSDTNSSERAENILHVNDVQIIVREVAADVATSVVMPNACCFRYKTCDCENSEIANLLTLRDHRSTTIQINSKEL